MKNYNGKIFKKYQYIYMIIPTFRALNFFKLFLVKIRTFNGENMLCHGMRCSPPKPWYFRETPCGRYLKMLLDTSNHFETPGAPRRSNQTP